MTYRTLMAHLDLGQDNRAILNVTKNVATRFGAAIIGIAGANAAPLPPDPLGYSGVMDESEMAILEGRQYELDVAACEKKFRAAFKGSSFELEWRSSITPFALPAYIAGEAQAADLIVTGPTLPFNLLDTSTRLNVGSLVLQAGRPILQVPLDCGVFTARKVLISWKNTREARRAVVDALPFLLEADTVTVLEVARVGEVDVARTRTADVAQWLSRHGISASAHAVPVNETKLATLRKEIAARAPDLVVAGAYGHSRMNEWVFGGVTQSLLLKENTFCVLMSH